MLNFIVFCSGEGSVTLDVTRTESNMPFSIKQVVCNNRDSWQ